MSSAHELQPILDDQHGVILRTQVLAAGAPPWLIKRKLRRREWVRALPGVFLDHTGRPTWLQRAWIGVLALGPEAALAGESAIRVTMGPGWRHHRDDAPIEIAVDRDRRLRAPTGYHLVRTAHLASRVQWHLGPPRMRLEHAVLAVAVRQPTEFAVIGRLADAAQSRRTTPARLLEALETWPRIPRRRWLHAVLTDLADGTCSVLEHAFLARVHRAHGLPPLRRQHVRGSVRGTEYVDATYPGLATDVELDGRLFHDTAGQRDRDLDRDLAAAAGGSATVRLGWGQVVERPCHTAGRLAQILRARGWNGTPTPCNSDCPVLEESVAAPVWRRRPTRWDADTTEGAVG